MSDTASVTETEVGLFHVCYEVDNGLPGGVLCTLNLVVFTPTKAVSGFGHITQAVNPPLDLRTKLEGNYSYMTVMPDTTHILVILTGHPVMHWPYAGGVGPVIPPNANLRMVLQEDWKSGTATLEYSDASGTWQTTNDAPVQSKPCTSLS